MWLLSPGFFVPTCTSHISSHLVMWLGVSLLILGCVLGILPATFVQHTAGHHVGSHFGFLGWYFPKNFHCTWNASFNALSRDGFISNCNDVTNVAHIHSTVSRHLVIIVNACVLESTVLVRLMNVNLENRDIDI